MADYEFFGGSANGAPARAGMRRDAGPAAHCHVQFHFEDRPAGCGPELTPGEYGKYAKAA
jgi:hypothetical protein